MNYNASHYNSLFQNKKDLEMHIIQTVSNIQTLINEQTLHLFIHFIPIHLEEIYCKATLHFLSSMAHVLALPYF